MVQFHNNGEPLLYPDLQYAISLFSHCHTGLDTNGKALVERAFELIDVIDTLTVSFIPNDPERDDQLDQVERFLQLRGSKKPLVVFRILGQSDTEIVRYLAQKHGCLITHRVLHAAMGSWKYSSTPLIPEFGICTEILHKLSIDRYGDVSPCVRFDPKKINVLGDINEESLADIWQSEKRLRWVEYHKQGFRDKVPLCGPCEYYGIAKG
jgi:radical SAM protein with 4Fe4S-binding SPASM domain